MAHLSDKVVLITGGAGGLGKAYAKTFLEMGCKVCLGDVNVKLGNKTLEELAGEFGAENIKFCVLDVTQYESFKAAFMTCKDTFGPVKILVNNAGITNELNWKLTMDVNLGGTIRGTELALENMSKAKGHEGGQIINMGSIAGIQVYPYYPFYSAIKSGIIHYTRTAGDPFHFAYTGVGIQCLCPASVDTPLIRTSNSMPYTPESQAAVANLPGSIPLLETEEVSKALMQLLKENKPGSVMVVEKGKEPRYVDARTS